jgi:hypothetical protein
VVCHGYENFEPFVEIGNVEYMNDDGLFVVEVCLFSIGLWENFV